MDGMLLTLIEVTTLNNNAEEHCIARLSAPVYPEPPVITTDISLSPGNAGSQHHSTQASLLELAMILGFNEILTNSQHCISMGLPWIVGELCISMHIKLNIWSRVAGQIH
jgi:hypothetical protein